MNQDMELKMLVRATAQSLYDYQEARIKADGHARVKADGEPQKRNGTTPAYVEGHEKNMLATRAMMAGLEDKMERDLAKLVRQCPEWEGFLKDVKGCGPKMAAILISEIDIEKATTVSKIWQYAGMNPGMVRGKVVKTAGGERVHVVTDDLVRGDKPTKGYVLPYNKLLKTKLLGVLATSFLMSKSPYAARYYEEKTRLENSDRPVNGRDGLTWRTTTPAHRDAAAKRVMVKAFLQDYYAKVRAMYGLEVRPPYQEEYLGHVHGK